MTAKSVVYKLFIILVAFTLIAPVSTLAGSLPAPSASGKLGPLAPTATSVTKYFDDRAAAMALNYDTELYLCGMIHSANGYDPATAAARSQKTRVGWPNLIQDAETYQIPLSFNICGHEAVFGDTGRTETAAIDVTYSWADPHWATNTWYSDKPQNGGNYMTTGALSGTSRSYGLVYGGDMTEQTLNSTVPFEISYHNFGHESLSNLSSAEINATFGLGVQYHQRIGNKIRAEAPPWNNNPSTASYPVYVQNGIFVFNRSEGPMQDPYEAIDNLWIVPRAGAFNASTDLRSTIDTAITNGVVLADYSHPEDGFDSSSRSAFQTSLAYARSKVDSGDLWATTLSEIGRYWEAKADASISESTIGGKTIVDVTLPEYDATLFGIPYLTFKSPMPNDASYARITVDFPSAQVLNSNSSTVRVADGQVTYSVYLNPTGTTHVEIEGVDTPFTGGVDINTPVLSIDSTPPVDALTSSPVTIQATASSTDAIYSANLIYQRNSAAKDSKIMALNAGLWEANIGPFNAGDVISYYVSVTDNSGRRERSALKSFTIQAGPDLDSPSWRNQGQSNATPAHGRAVQLYAQGLDAVALRTATLWTDETGVWEAKATYGSPMNLGDASNTWVASNFTWNNAAILADTTVSWKIVYADAVGNESTTETMSFTIQDVPLDDQPPQYSSPSVSSSTAGQPAQFSLRWTDNEALAGYTFSIDNGTGTFVDDPYTDFTEAAAGGNWWDPAWLYRRVVTLDNSAYPVALTDYAVLLSVDTASLIATGKMNADGGDIRFLDDATELDFWVESGMDTANTRIWVKVPTIPASSTKSIAMYYGNPNRTIPLSDGAKTFSFFDSFGGQGWEGYKYGDTPVMGPGSTAGGSGTFSSVLRESETLWRMYSSYDSDNRDIGMSTSTDGISWTHQGVVLRKGAAGSWDSSNIWCPAVWKEGSTYYMLYPASGSYGTTMGLATSPDGVNWTKYAGNPVFNDPNWASGDTESPCFSVMKDDGTYYVMYNTLGASKRQSSIAYSTDLFNWTPAYNYARFPGGTNPSDWNYNMFCGHMFKYEDHYYVIFPGQDSSHDYAKFGLYVSHSPLFPESDTEFKGIVMIGEQTGWDAGDMDTPWLVPFNNMMHLYYAACGACWTQTGLAVLNNIPQALTGAYPPGNYVNTNRAATTSLQIMPPAGWQKSLAGYLEVDGQNFDITLNQTVSGRATVLKDTNATLPLELYKDIPSQGRAQISAWVKADSNNTGDYDLYLYGDTYSTQALAAGLGGNGYFHYWNGAFVDTAIPYSADAWYKLQVKFDVASDFYDFTVYSATGTQLLNVEGIPFGTPITNGIDRAMFRTSTEYNGYAYLDDVLLRQLAATEPGVTVGAEATQIFTDAWSRATQTLNATVGSTIRWRFSAKDISDNWTDSEIYTFVTQAVDDPPSVILNAPANHAGFTTATVDFRATCSDETDIAQMSLWGDWSGAWAQVDSRTAPGLNNVEVTFTKTVPDGDWTWNIRCEDNTGHISWATTRTFSVDTRPAPWWHSNFHYRIRLTVHENSGHALSSYPVYAVVNTYDLIATGKMKPDCSDVRITYNGSEIPSQVTGCGSPTAKIWLQTDLASLQSKRGFYLYYGNPLAPAPDYSAQSSLQWNSGTYTMNTGKITSTFNPAGGVISQVKNNSNNQNLMTGTARGLGYLFSHNPSVYEIFYNSETNDTIVLTIDGPIVKVVTAYSGESPQWTQENYFYNNADFIDFTAYRPATISELFLTGADRLTPDGVFSNTDANELLRVDNATTDTTVPFDNIWRFTPTTNQGYMGLVDPSFTNELAFLWDKELTTDFTWKPRTDDAGTYSLFIGGNGTTGTYGTINAETFGYRFVLKTASSPSNGDTQSMLDYYLTNPPTVTLGGEEYQESDSTPPTVTILSPTNTNYEGTSVLLSFTTSEAVEWCGYSLNGGATVPIPNCSDMTLTSLPIDTHALTVYARDYASNTGSSTVNFTVVGDITPPTVTITSPTHTSYTSNAIALSFSASEPVDLCSYSLNSGTPVAIPGCSNTNITIPANGAYNLTLSARDLSGNTGSASVIFGVAVSTTGWWDAAWQYRIPVTISTGAYSRRNEPVELDINFTALWAALGETGLSLEPNSIRVVEYTSSDAPIGEVASQFDQAGGYDPATNATGTVDWILYGTTPAGTNRYYYVYFDSTAHPKAAPGYVTDLAWNGSTYFLSNTTIQALLYSRSLRSGISSLRYNGTEYTASNSTGFYYLQSTSDALTYSVLVNGPVKKTIRITPPSNGNVSFTLYDQAEFVKAEGNVTGLPLSFTMFPYLQFPNQSVLSRQFHYFDGGAVVNETENGQGWLGHRPGEGWACYDGLGTFKDLCLVTNAATLASSNNLFRGATSAIIFPAWYIPNATVPIQPVSYVVMADTYQDGRDFWNKLAAPVTKTPGDPQSYQPPPTPQAPVVGNIPDQTIDVGGTFTTIQLTSFVTDPDNLLTELAWGVTGNSALTVSIDSNQVATISYPGGWTGSETISFTAYDPNLLNSSDSVTFEVSGPTAVTVSSFTASSHMSTAQLDWETANEIGLLGFNLYRSETPDGLKHKLNADLIPAQHSGQMQGASYQFSDFVDQGRRYYYWLELAKTQGTELLDPVVVNTDYLVQLPFVRR